MIDEGKILDTILKSRGPVTTAELARRFRIKGNDRRELRAMLQDLVANGKIARLPGGKSYAPPSGRSGEIIGRLEVTSRGFGFVRPDWSGHKGRPPFDGDLFVSPRDMGDALEGDLVRAELMARGREGASGRVTSVIEHAHERIVGFFQRKGNDGEVVPRNKKIDRRIVVPRPAKELGVSDFDWVEVEILQFTRDPEPLIGRILSRIGSDEDRGIDVLLVLRDRGIVEEFPAAVEFETKELKFDWDEDLKGRVDYRKLPTITIDPETAKDFDDALSIERIPEGWRLYVHIADVAHFVRQGTALDREAQDRSTSVYPVDRVVPMLPHKISNYLCSLIPNEDRLVVTAIMDIDQNGDLTAMKFANGVIHSHYRFAYEQVQAVFDGKAGENPPFADLLPMIADLRAVAKVLRKTRFKRGALDLDLPELKVVFDEKGKAVDIKFAPRFEAHQLVEECMLIANEAVAQHLTKKEAPLLYRIHEVADEDRLEKLQPVLKAFGISLGRGDKSIKPKDIQIALEKAQAMEGGHVIRRLILRALKRAEYSPENVGHFGLASDCYCHFTSPIRRYPDVVVHRQLKALIEHTPLVYPQGGDELDSLGEHTSQRERRAQEAEWESVAIKSLEFFKQFEGDEFDGLITSVQNWGLFIELQPYPVEGLVKKVTIRGDQYDLDEHGIKLVGRNTGHTLKLGGKVRVQVERVDPMAQQLDLKLLDLPEVGGKRARKGRR